MISTVYIAPKIFEWDAHITSAYNTDSSDWRRPYDILGHAEKLIEINDSDFHISDTIANLKRALNHRLKKIEEYYRLNSINFKSKPKGYLELLEKYDLAKPFIIKRLMDIRNDIEHNDMTPPERDRCLELIDVTWYFLKSTDRLISSVTSEWS